MKIIARLLKMSMLSKRPKSKKVRRKIIIKIAPSVTVTSPASLSIQETAAASIETDSSSAAAIGFLGNTTLESTETSQNASPASIETSESISPVSIKLDATTSSPQAGIKVPEIASDLQTVSEVVQQQQTVPGVSSIPIPPPPPRAPPAPTLRRASSALVALNASEFASASQNVLAAPKPYTTYRGAQLPNVSLENILMAKANLKKTSLREKIADFYEKTTPSLNNEQKNDITISREVPMIPEIVEVPQVRIAPKATKVSIVSKASEGPRMPLVTNEDLVQSRLNLRHVFNSPILKYLATAEN